MTDNTYGGQRNKKKMPFVWIDRGAGKQRFSSKKVHSLGARFDWGFCGTGPMTLALAILLEETSRDEAERRYMDFYLDLLVLLPVGEWHLTSGAVQSWLMADREMHPLAQETFLSL